MLASLWGVGDNDGYHQFRSLHIPTSFYFDAARALAGLPGSRYGRNPLPDADRLQQRFDEWGIRTDRPVVVYDQGRGLLAGRAWWILRWAGVRDVRILNGGLQKWIDEGLPTITGPGNITVDSDFQVATDDSAVATIEDVKTHEGILLDTRETPRFAGFREHLDLKAGHIPGAVNIPQRELCHPGDYTWKSPEEIRQIFADAGITEANMGEVIVYSGSGNHSALTLAAMESVGLQGARHYVGGWSQWSANPANPVERGQRSSLA